MGITELLDYGRLTIDSDGVDVEIMLEGRYGSDSTFVPLEYMDDFVARYLEMRERQKT